MPLYPRDQRIHKPVMIREVIEALGLESKVPLKHQARLSAGRKLIRIIDATVGAGGHSEEVIKRGGKIFGIDADARMIKIARENLKRACPTPHQDGGRCFTLIQGNFKDIEKLTRGTEFRNVDAIIFDLGVSSIHLANSKLGFSFKDISAPLDMRLNPEFQKVRASDLLNNLRQDQLEQLFSTVLSEAVAKVYAKKVVDIRSKKQIKTVGDFLPVVGEMRRPGEKLHPATKPFLALRLYVNSELENLRKALPAAFNLLKKRGKLIVISFHSLEDKIAKNFFKKKQLEKKGMIITEKPLRPKSDEIFVNPRARSARLRVLMKI